MDRRSHYDWIAADPEYVKAFADAEARFADKVRGLVREGAEGVRVPVFYQGKQITDLKGEPAYNILRSDRLLELLAKAKCAEFRDKQEISGPDGGPVQIQVITGVPQPE